jgi:beta-glucanase (GH16 family)
LSAAGWRLVWDDEFEKTGWPDPSKWGCEAGMLRNSEPQYYMHSMENVRVSNMGLELVIRKEHVPRDRTGHSAEYTSASIDTSGKASWLYGRFEIQAVIPPGRFVWPAFWMVGTDRMQGVLWPKCGEVDIAEYFGRFTNPGVFSSVHFFNPSKHPPLHVAEIQGNTHGLCVTSVLHTYSLEWYPDRLDFYVDGWKYNSIDMSRIDDDGWGAFRKPMFLRLSLAMDKFGMPTDPAFLPARLLIRHVRIYQKQGAGLD